MVEISESESVNKLLSRLDELIRWRHGSKGKYIDLHSALERIQGTTNHVITGRRGSGKTRLLDELRIASDNTKYTVITIGIEDFKELSYPDILIQILRTLLLQFRRDLEQKPLLLSKNWFNSMLKFVKDPIHGTYNNKRHKQLLFRANKLATNLDEMLAESDELEAEYLCKGSDQRMNSSATQLATESLIPVTGSLKISNQLTSSAENSRTHKQKEVKRIKVERLLGDFKQLLSDYCEYHDSKLILTVDDFYFIRRNDQPKVIDYIHRICKDTDAYLKVATIKHRTMLFEHTDIARGVVLGHEIQPIDLELPLGEFESITRYMKSIWASVCSDTGIEDTEELFIGDGFEQAVLASGGVPRDFFGIVKEALLIARERRERGIGKRRVNEAARRYAETTKFPELHIDITRDQKLIEILLFDLIRFTREAKKKNCFHIDLEKLEASQDLRHLFDALADSRLIHLISDNTSSSRRTGRYAAYLLDVGLYGHPERRGDRSIEEIEFWARDSVGRLMNLSRSPIYPVRTISELEDCLSKIEDQNTDIRTFILEPEEKNSDMQSENTTEKQDCIQLALPFIED